MRACLPVPATALQLTEILLGIVYSVPVPLCLRSLSLFLCFRKNKTGFLKALTNPNVSIFRFDTFPDRSFETVKRVDAIKDICSFRLPFPRMDSLDALYPHASLLQYSCAPNTRPFFDIPDAAAYKTKTKLGRVSIKAVQHIRK